MTEAPLPTAASPAGPPAARRPGPTASITALVCSLLLVAFAVASWSAMRSKSPTYDEPMHAMGAYVLSHDGDHRINPEDPPLWQWWMSLATPPGELKLNLDDPHFRTTPGAEAARWRWAFESLYLTPGNDPDVLFARVRVMLVLLGVALGAVIAWWSWRLAGGVAAIAAVTLFALDPNFLAHAAAVKNDVAITLVGTALAFATWCAGRRLTRATGLAVILLGAAALVTKFSGPLLLIALAATLAVRVALPITWPCGDRLLTTVLARAAAAASLLLLTGLAGYFAIWACYGFRYALGPTAPSGTSSPSSSVSPATRRSPTIPISAPPARRNSTNAWPIPRRSSARCSSATPTTCCRRPGPTACSTSTGPPACAAAS